MKPRKAQRSRALLIDYGGVLTTSIAASFRSFCANEGIDPRAFQRALFADPSDDASPIARVETGAITQQEFDMLVAERLTSSCGTVVSAERLKERMFARVRPDDAMRSAVRQMRAAGVPTVLVSNSWGGDDYPLDELRPLFDAMLLSGALGLRKPAPEIYLRAAETAGHPPRACVFVDDLHQNVAGAEAVGMTAILHRDAAPTRARLQDLFDIRFED